MVAHEYGSHGAYSGYLDIQQPYEQQLAPYSTKGYVTIGHLYDESTLLLF